MTPSLRLLLEDFLGLMREEGELDVFLPLLLSAMGHEVVYRAQKGTRQYGVDISSVGKDTDGKKKLFLWLIKCGDIGRDEWDSGRQSIRQSMNDASDTYVESHVAPQHAKLPKKLVILTNGDFNAAINLTIATYMKTWAKRNRVEADMVNGSTLAAWTEHFLLDEHVLPPSNKALLRRMLANVGSPELSVAVGRELIESLVTTALVPAKTSGARRKRQLSALRGIRTALSVLQVWAQNERNRVAPYTLSEFAVLCVWSNLHEEVGLGNREVMREFAALVKQMAEIAEGYHEVLQPYYSTQDALASTLPDSLLVTDAAFRELGRIGLQGCFWALIAAVGRDTFAESLAGVYINRLVALLDTHACTQSPAYDHHAVDIHAALLLLLVGNRREEARQWLTRLAGRLANATKAIKHWPISAQFDDALAVRHGDAEMSPDFMSTSTLLPVLLIWSAALKMNDLYAFVRETILPAVPKTTLNLWSSDVGFDKLLADPSALHEHGVGEGVLHVPADPEEFLRTMSSPLPGVESIEQAPWYKFRVPYIPLLAALHWRLQVPREMLVKQAMAVTGY